MSQRILFPKTSEVDCTSLFPHLHCLRIGFWLFSKDKFIYQLHRSPGLSGCCCLFIFFFLLCQFPKRYYMVFENKVFWESHYGAVFSDLHFMNREKYYCLCPGFPVSKQDLLIFLLARVRFCFWLVEEAFVHLKPRNGRCYSPFPFFCT